jgi:hypothetical protein
MTPLPSSFLFYGGGIMERPKLDDYSLKALIALGEQTSDLVLHDYIVSVILKRFLAFNYSIFYLVNKFLKHNDIMKEVYSDMIIIWLKDHEYNMSEWLIDDVIKFASLDILTEYGITSCNLYLCLKSEVEFWDRAIELEDKSELIKKKYMDNCKFKTIVNVEKKGE